MAGFRRSGHEQRPTVGAETDVLVRDASWLGFRRREIRIGRPDALAVYRGARRKSWFSIPHGVTRGIYPVHGLAVCGGRRGIADRVWARCRAGAGGHGSCVVSRWERVGRVGRVEGALGAPVTVMTGLAAPASGCARAQEGALVRPRWRPDLSAGSFWGAQRSQNPTIAKWAKRAWKPNCSLIRSRTGSRSSTATAVTVEQRSQ